MPNVHPIVVHFPIALFITGLVVDVLGHLAERETLKKMGLVLVVLGALGALAAMLTGLSVEETVEAGLSEAGEAVLDNHAQLGQLTAYLLLGVAVLRILLATTWVKWPAVFGATLAVYLIAGVVGLGLLTVTGYRGGQLVYEHGAGVKLTQPIEKQSSADE